MPGLIEIFAIAVGLGSDAFCTAFGIGTARYFSGQTFRLSFHFGLFQSLMPVLGWLLGQQLADWVSTWDHWLAGGILLLIGLHMLWEAFQRKKEVAVRDRSRKWDLVLLSVATSIDALAVGVVFGVYQMPILMPVLVIGLVAAAMTMAGLHLGRLLKKRTGTWIQVLGALILIGLSIKFFQI